MLTNRKKMLTNSKETIKSMKKVTEWTVRDRLTNKSIKNLRSQIEIWVHFFQKTLLFSLKQIFLFSHLRCDQLSQTYWRRQWTFYITLYFIVRLYIRGFRIIYRKVLSKSMSSFSPRKHILIYCSTLFFHHFMYTHWRSK